MPQWCPQGLSNLESLKQNWILLQVKSKEVNGSKYIIKVALAKVVQTIAM